MKNLEELAKKFRDEIADGSGKLYAYKETYFTGFAPCFDGDLYSLACCKGNRKTGGLRRSVCKWIEGKDMKGPSKPHSAWILTIAGKDIRKTDKDGQKHDASGINYEYGDLIALVRVSDEKIGDGKYRYITTWPVYGEDPRYCKRADSIYVIDENDNNEMVHDGSDQHADEKFWDTDLGKGMKEGYTKVNQILLSEQYIVFPAGTKLCKDFWETIQSKRSISEEDANGDGMVSSIRKIFERIENGEIVIKYCCTSPFAGEPEDSDKSSCEKRRECTR